MVASRPGTDSLFRSYIVILCRKVISSNIDENFSLIRIFDQAICQGSSKAAPCNKRMQSDQKIHYAFNLTADARRYVASRIIEYLKCES